MTLPHIYDWLDPNDIPDDFFSWDADVELTSPWSGDVPPVVLRDANGNPIERIAPTQYLTVPVAEWPPSPSERQLFEQMGQQLDIVLVFRQDPVTGLLPDIPLQSRIVFPAGGSRYFSVVKSVDVGDAGVILQVFCMEQIEGRG